MSDYMVLKKVVLSPKHVPTGKTHHYRGNAELPSATMLKIAKYKDDEGFYLLQFDNDGNELTDTFHDSLEEALEQAEWEYQVTPDEWENV